MALKFLAVFAPDLINRKAILQIPPKLLGGSEILGQPSRHFGGKLPLFANNVVDRGSGNMQLHDYALRFPFPEKYPASACPVYDFFTRATCSGVPCATTRPPSSPPSGPRSMIQSALRTTSRLCSMMMIELPRSVNRCSTSSNFFTSSKCSPVVGSSSRYSVLPV